MFGLEKKKPNKFEFDLEKDLKKDRKKATTIIKEAEARTNELKGLLREGSASENFDAYGILLHAYTALVKVINKVVK